MSLLFLVMLFSSLIFSMPFPIQDDPPLIARITDEEFDHYIEEILTSGTPECVEQMILMSRIRRYYRLRRPRKPQQSG